MQVWLSPENLMTLVWKNGLDLAKIVRCQFGRQYDGSEARNSYASLVATCMDRQRICTVSHVNVALQQPHWRSHEALLKQQQVKPNRVAS